MIGHSAGQPKVFNGNSYASIYSFYAHTNKIYRIKQSPFGNRNLVAKCSRDSTVKVWNSFANWNLIRTYTGHSNLVYGLEWINLDTIASGGFSDYTIKIWSISSGQTLRTIYAGTYVSSLKLLNNGIHLAAGLNPNINI